MHINPSYKRWRFFISFRREEECVPPNHLIFLYIRFLDHKTHHFSPKKKNAKSFLCRVRAGMPWIPQDRHHYPEFILDFYRNEHTTGCCSTWQKGNSLEILTWSDSEHVKCLTCKKRNNFFWALTGDRNVK